MEPKIITLEPERTNSLLKWWSDPSAQTLLDCLSKARSLATVKAAELQMASIADGGNQNFAASATEELKEAARFDTAISVLEHFFPDGPFIARIES